MPRKRDLAVREKNAFFAARYIASNICTGDLHNAETSSPRYLNYVTYSKKHSRAIKLNITINSHSFGFLWINSQRVHSAKLLKLTKQLGKLLWAPSNQYSIIRKHQDTKLN